MVLNNKLQSAGAGVWHFTLKGSLMIIAHVLSGAALYLILSGRVPLFPVILNFLLFIEIGFLGTGVGSHRLWAHRSYKAKLPLRVLLMLCQTVAGQDSILKWSRNHRLHHKFCETDADPHNIKRGFFYSHMGWYLIEKHPDVNEKAKTLDLSDLEGDPVVAFQSRHIGLLSLLLFFFIPTTILYLYCGAPTIFSAVCLNSFRHVISIHLASLGNSAAHSWDRKPYETKIGPADISWLSLLIAGEGWHNFHHVFPWDYRSTDVGFYCFNQSSIFIDFFARIGWAYDLKTVSDEVIQKRAKRTGDGSHPGQIIKAKKKICLTTENSSEKSNLNINEDFNLDYQKMHDIDKLTFNGNLQGIGPGPWGWGDSDIAPELIEKTVTAHNNNKVTVKT